MTDEYYMMLAIKEARKALDAGEIPVGTIIVMHDRVIARGHNMIEKLNDPTAHSEIIALTSAFNYLGSKYLPEASLYVTVEPCLMCAGALYWSKIRKVVWGADDEKNGHERITKDEWVFHPKTEIIKSVLKEECSELMKSFFGARR